MRLIEALKHNVDRGRSNRYRGCCIAWFSLAWNPVLSEIAPFQRWYNRLTWVRIPAERPLTQVQYIPCPLCLLRRSFDYDESQRHVDITMEDLETMMFTVEEDEF